MTGGTSTNKKTTTTDRAMVEANEASIKFIKHHANHGTQRDKLWCALSSKGLAHRNGARFDEGKVREVCVELGIELKKSDDE